MEWVNAAGCLPLAQGVYVLCARVPEQKHARVNTQVCVHVCVPACAAPTVPPSQASPSCWESSFYTI